MVKCDCSDCALYLRNSCYKHTGWAAELGMQRADVASASSCPRQATLKSAATHRMSDKRGGLTVHELVLELLGSRHVAGRLESRSCRIEARWAIEARRGTKACWGRGLCSWAQVKAVVLRGHWHHKCCFACTMQYNSLQTGPVDQYVLTSVAALLSSLLQMTSRKVAAKS